MESSDSRVSASTGPWTSLWVVALISLLVQLGLCQFFTFGEYVPASIDVDPSNLWKFAYHFPPIGTFHVLNWLGVPYTAQPLNPLSLAAAQCSVWCFFTAYTPFASTLALLAMTAFLREFELTRPAALFGGLVYAWQGDILPFIYPGHYGYITTWPFYAIAAWAALRAERTGHWAYPLISGVSCGIMVGLLTNADRGAIASIFVAVLYLAAIVRGGATRRTILDHLLAFRPLALCVVVAAVVALAPLLALFQGNIQNVKMSGSTDRDQTYKLVTQFSLGPAESLTYLVPGFFGWHMNNQDGPYWGWIGESPDWPKTRQGVPNLNLAISTTGTVATVLALLGVVLLLWEGVLGRGRITGRQRFYGRVLLAVGFLALILSWGWHTPLYRPLFELPMMDKWRNPLKWLEMTNFALIVLSALGVEHLLVSLDGEASEAKAIRRRLAWFTLGLTILLGLGLAVSFPLSLVLGAALKADSFEPNAVANMMNTMHTSLLWAFLLMVLFCLVLRGLWRPEKLRGLTLVNPLLHHLWQSMLKPEFLPFTLALALAALSTAQLAWVAGQFIEPEQLSDMIATNPLLEALRSEGDTVRCSVAVGDPLLNQLLQNQFAAMNISCFDISAASRIPDDLNAFFQALGNNQSRLWFLGGVKNVVIPEEGLSQMRQDPGIAANIAHADGYTLEQPRGPNMPSHVLVGMKDYLAKVTLVPGVEILSDEDAVLKRLQDAGWNPRQTVLLARPVVVTVPPPLAPPATSGTSDEVALKTYTPTQIDIAAQTSRSGFVLIDDQYDSDWQVDLNGRDVPLLRADYILRAVAVPAGFSDITLHYVAHYHIAGLSLKAEMVSYFSDGAMLAAWLIAGYALWRQRR